MKSSVVSKIAHETILGAPSIMPTAPWWDHLESNFHQRPEGFELGLRELAQVRATAAFDKVIRTVGASGIASLAIPRGYHPRKLRQMIRDRELYEPLAETGDPSAFFGEPPPVAEVHVRAKRPLWRVFQPKDGICEDLSFDSPYEPMNPGIRDAYLSHEANRRAHARYWRHESGPRPTIMVIHGFGAEPYWLNEWLFAIPWFFQMGCDVVLLTLPFHGPRQSSFSPFSGYGLFANGTSHINEAFGQAVMDARLFLDYLERERGVTDVGVTGVSLGGYTTAILAAVEPRFRFAIPTVPLASLADLVLEWEPIGTMVRSLLFASKSSIKDLRHMLAVHCPLTYKPVIPKERLMIVGGVGDRLAPPKHSRLLWDHWDRCRIHWFPGSHLLQLDRGNYLRQMARFLNQIEFIQRDPEEEPKHHVPLTHLADVRRAREQAS